MAGADARCRALEERRRSRAPSEATPRASAVSRLRRADSARTDSDGGEPVQDCQGLPHVMVRFDTVPKVRDARISVGWALVFIALLYTAAPAVAVFARTNLLNTVSEQPYSDMPEWFTKWEETGLIAYADRNGDGLIQFVGPEATNARGAPIEN